MEYYIWEKQEYQQYGTIQTKVGSLKLPLPDLENDAIQVKVEATSVCGSDLYLER